MIEVPEIIAQSEHQPTLKDRLDRYGKLKRKQHEIVEGLANLGDQKASKLAVAMADCGNWLTFRDYYTVSQVRLVRACFCKKHLTCQLCAVRRAAKFLELNLAKIQHLLDSHPNLRPHFIVYTVKSGFDLAERLRHLESGWQKLRRRGSRPNRYPGSLLSSVYAGLFSLEVTYDAKQGWHPHFNLLVLSPKKSFNWQNAKDEWKAITGDSHVVHFSTDTHKLANTLAETIKYVTKINDLSAEQLWQLQTTLNGRKTVRGFGALHNLQVPHKLTDDVLEGDLPYIEYICRHLGSDGYTIYSALESAAGASEAQPSVHKTKEAERSFRRKCQGGAIKGA